MSIKYALNYIYDETINTVMNSNEKWKDVCKMIGQLYRYEFDNIILMYAQNPSATLVADFDTWKKVDRYVQKGSKSIMIFPSRALNSDKIQHVFDISNTKGAQKKLTWHFDKNTLRDYVQYIYGNDTTKNDIDILKDFLEKRVIYMLENEHPERITQIINENNSTTHKEDIKHLIKTSIIYAIETRCGIDTNDLDFKNYELLMSHEKLFHEIGALVSDSSCDILREISKDLKQIEDRKRKELSNERKEIKNNIHRDKWNILPQHRNPNKSRQTNSTAREIRNNGDRLYENELSSTLQNTVQLRKISPINERSGNRNIQVNRADRERLHKSKSSRDKESKFNNGNVEVERTSKDVRRRNSNKTNSEQISLELIPKKSIDETEYSFKEKVNFHYSDNKWELSKGGAKTRYKYNIEAIKTLKNIEKENRLATPEEQDKLSLYVGWGGISQVFDKTNSSWTNEYKELQEILNDDEYNAARASVNNSFFTDPKISECMYNAINNFGFKKGNILEPSMGIGNFFGSIPDTLKESNLYGIEIDNVTGRIAKQLYQNADISITGFENTSFPDNFFDVAIGNVPFGDYKVHDIKYDKNNLKIHDYFICKALDQVKPGGIVSFITTKGTLDKNNSAFRKYIAQRAELVGAVRLPNTAFKENAGTEVTSDIIFLQKRERKIDIEPDWIHLGLTEDKIPINSYFIEHPEMMLGHMVYDKGRFGENSKYTTCINTDENFDLYKELNIAFNNMSTNPIINLEELDENDKLYNEYIIPANTDVKNYTYTIFEDELFFRKNSIMVKSDDITTELVERIKSLNDLRITARELITIQTNNCSEQELQDKQYVLNEKYDNFVKTYGSINSKLNKKAFREDSDYPLLCSLEDINKDGEIKKADIFFKRTIRPIVKIERVDTAIEALNVCINEYGKINIPYMLKIYNPSISTELTATEFSKRKFLIKELEGIIFMNPSKYNPTNLNEGWETADEYLSGNVRNKLSIAEIMCQTEPELFAKNVESLKNVQPAELNASEIDVKIGTLWIDKEDYEKFLYELLNTPEQYMAVRNKYYNTGIQLNFNKITGEYFIENKSYDKDSVMSTKTYGTNRIDAYTIFENSLNLRMVTVRDRVDDGGGKYHYVINKNETMLAREKQTQMKQAFKDWIFENQERRKKYVDYYNKTFNNIRLREYDGSNLQFPGMNPEIELRKHQKNAIARILQGNNTLLAHTVGAGKSFVMMAATMEKKRLGLANKTIMVVPKPLIKQTANEFLRLYPSANLLITSEKDFEKNKRKQFVSRIATGDYDCIIMSHSQFEKIPISKKRKEKLLNKQIDEITTSIEEMKNSRNEKWTIKQMEAHKKRLDEQLKKLSDESKKDDLITFEELGVDSIMVDEAHAFKNCAIFSKMNNVSGISSTGSKKATDMLLKCQYINEQNNNKGIVFATGTPVSNSMCELYIMQNYLQKNKLEEMGIHSFDSWATNFGEVTTALELSVEGSGFRLKNRFNKFTNLPELMNIFKEVADVQTTDMLNLNVPKLKNDKYVIVESEPDEYTKQKMDEFVKRAELIRNGSVPTNIDNFLKITHEAKLLGTDAKLLDEFAPNNPDGKLNKVIANVYKEYLQSKEEGKIGCQMIFSDIGVPRENTFDVYNYIKNELVKKGIDKQDIAFIHNAKTDAQRDTLFKEIRTGKKKILIGSTDKCGTGVNIQDHLIALHHIDCPWKPSSIEQREGRILRQGNENDKVNIYRYVTKGTFDAYNWSIVENKQRFISQIMTSKTVSRNCEDIDEATLSYAEIKAIATGDDSIREKMELDNDVQRLNLLKSAYNKQKYALEDNINILYPKQIKQATERLDLFKKDIILRDSYSSNDFNITINNKVFSQRADGGNILLDKISSSKNGETTLLGKMNGFDLLVEKNYIGNSYLVLRGNISHRVELSNSAIGNITKLENLLKNMPETEKKLQNKLYEHKKNLDAAIKEYQKPFIYENELNQKLLKQNEFNNKLDLINTSTTNEVVDKDEIEQSELIKCDNSINSSKHIYQYNNNNNNFYFIGEILDNGNIKKITNEDEFSNIFDKFDEITKKDTNISLPNKLSIHK